METEMIVPLQLKQNLQMGNRNNRVSQDILQLQPLKYDLGPSHIQGINMSHFRT